MYLKNAALMPGSHARRIAVVPAAPTPAARWLTPHPAPPRASVPRIAHSVAPHRIVRWAETESPQSQSDVARNLARPPVPPDTEDAERLAGADLMPGFLGVWGRLGREIHTALLAEDWRRAERAACKLAHLADSHRWCEVSDAALAAGRAAGAANPAALVSTLTRLDDLRQAYVRGDRNRSDLRPGAEASPRHANRIEAARSAYA